MVLDELAAFEQTASQGAGGMGEAFRFQSVFNENKGISFSFQWKSKNFY